MGACIDEEKANATHSAVLMERTSTADCNALDLVTVRDDTPEVLALAPMQISPYLTAAHFLALLCARMFDVNAAIAAMAVRVKDICFDKYTTTDQECLKTFAALNRIVLLADVGQGKPAGGEQAAAQDLLLDIFYSVASVQERNFFDVHDLMHDDGYFYPVIETVEINTAILKKAGYDKEDVDKMLDYIVSALKCAAHLAATVKTKAVISPLRNSNLLDALLAVADDLPMWVANTTRYGIHTWVDGPMWKIVDKVFGSVTLEFDADAIEHALACLDKDTYLNCYRKWGGGGDEWLMWLHLERYIVRILTRTLNGRPGPETEAYRELPYSTKQEHVSEMLSGLGKNLCKTLLDTLITIQEEAWEEEQTESWKRVLRKCVSDTGNRTSAQKKRKLDA